MASIHATSNMMPTHVISSEQMNAVGLVCNNNFLSILLAWNGPRSPFSLSVALTQSGMEV